MPIKTKLLIFALSVSLIPISIIIAVFYINDRHTLKHHAMQEMTAIAESRRRHLLAYVDAKKERAIDFASDGFIKERLETICRGVDGGHVVSILNRHLKMNKMPLDPHILAIEVVGIDGMIVSSTIKTSIGKKASDYEDFQQLLNGAYGDACFKESHHSGTINRIDIDVSAPLFPMSGDRPIGLIILHYDPSAFNAITKDRTGMGRTGEVYVVNRNKIMLTESRFIENAVLKQVVDTEPVRRIIDDDSGEMVGIYPDYRGVPIVGASVDMPEYGWILLAEVDKDEIFAPIVSTGIFTIIMGSISAVSVVFIAIFFSRKITMPIQRLVDGTRRIRKGDLAFKLKTESKDEIGYLSASFNDMTSHLGESKRQLEDYAQNLEQKVEDKTKRIKLMLDELKYKNKEMEQIIYVASHDLRSPLLNIQGFSKELENSIKQIHQKLNESAAFSEVKDKLTDILEEDIPDALRFILASSSRMDKLLSGLLRISRMGRVTLAIKQLDMNKLIYDVIGVHEYKIKEAKVTCQVEELPSCSGDEVLINQLFSNLLDNALKYLDSDREGIISISGRREKGYVVYCLEDNGIGITEGHRNKIFEIFQRLNPNDGLAGDGLGLTIVSKILDLHGGKISVESEPGKGSRFIVSLPE